MTDYELNAKLKKLRELIDSTGGMAIAFSGGVDSTFLAAVARDVLGERALAVTALSPTYPAGEQISAARLAGEIGIRHVEVRSNELELPGFAANPPNRCYLCKRSLFEVIGRVAREHGITVVADGSNRDDAADYRPGMHAAAEAGVRKPLLEAGLCKADIRRLSRRMGLPTADKPALACLASRFPYGTRITEEKLKAVDSVEETLRSLGFRQVRVRHHGTIARIEVEPSDLMHLCAEDVRSRVIRAVRAAGFIYAAVDLEGYRTGSMNAVLLETEKKKG